MSNRSPNVYKLIVVFIYGEYSWLTRVGDGILEFNTRNAAKFIYAKACQLRDYMRWLQQHEYISELEIGHGYCRFRFNPPKLLLKELGHIKSGEGRKL
jgi:hypothetical protein